MRVLTQIEECVCVCVCVLGYVSQRTRTCFFYEQFGNIFSGVFEGPGLVLRFRLESGLDLGQRSGVRDQVRSWRTGEMDITECREKSRKRSENEIKVSSEGKWKIGVEEK